MHKSTLVIVIFRFVGLRTSTKVRFSENRLNCTAYIKEEFMNMISWGEGRNYLLYGPFEVGVVGFEILHPH